MNYGSMTIDEIIKYLNNLGDKISFEDLQEVMRTVSVKDSGAKSDAITLLFSGGETSTSTI